MARLNSALISSLIVTYFIGVCAQYSSLPTPTITTTPLAVSWVFPSSPNPYANPYEVIFQMLITSELPSIPANTWKTVYRTVLDSPTLISTPICGLSPQTDYQFRYMLRALKDNTTLGWGYFNASTTAMRSDLPSITVSSSANHFQTSLSIDLSRPVLVNDVQVVCQKRTYDSDEPWTTVGIGYINFLHSSEELTKLSITDSIQTSLNTEYRCKVLGHTESNWVSSYAFVTGQLNDPDISVVSRDNVTGMIYLSWTSPTPPISALFWNVLIYEFERTYPEFGLNDTFLPLYRGPISSASFYVLPYTTYKMRARAFHRSLNTYLPYTNVYEYTTGSGPSTTRPAIGAPKFTVNSSPTSVPGLFYVDARISRSETSDSFTEINVTNILEPSKSFIWREFYHLSLLFEAKFVLEAGQYQIWGRCGIPEEWSPWQGPINLTLESPPTEPPPPPPPPPTSNILDEAKPLPEAYIMSNEMITLNRLKVVQLLVLPTTDVPLNTYFNVTARLQYSTTGIEGPFIDLEPKAASEATNSPWMLFMRANTSYVFRARYENATAVSSWSAPFFTHHFLVGTPYAYVFPVTGLNDDPDVSLMNMATNVLALNDSITSITLSLTDSHSFTTNLSSSELDKTAGIPMRFSYLPPGEFLQPNITFVTDSSSSFTLPVDKIRTVAALRDTPTVSMFGVTYARISIDIDARWVSMLVDIANVTMNAVEPNWTRLCNLTGITSSNPILNPGPYVCEYRDALPYTLYFIRITTVFADNTSDPVVTYHVVRSTWCTLEVDITTLPTSDYPLANTMLLYYRTGDTGLRLASAAILDSCPYSIQLTLDSIEMDFQLKNYWIELSQGASSYNTTGIWKKDWYPIANGSMQEFYTYNLRTGVKQVYTIPYWLSPPKFYYIRIGVASGQTSDSVTRWNEYMIDLPKIAESQIPDCCILANLCHEPGPPECVGPKPYPFAFCRNLIWMIKSSDLAAYAQSDSPYLYNNGTTYVVDNVTLSENSTLVYVVSTLPDEPVLNVSGMALIDGKLLFEIPKNMYSSGMQLNFLNSAEVNGELREISVTLLDDYSSCPTQVKGVPIKTGLGSMSILFESIETECSTDDVFADGISAGAVAGILVAVIVIVAGAVVVGGYLYKRFMFKKQMMDTQRKLQTFGESSRQTNNDKEVEMMVKRDSTWKVGTSRNTMLSNVQD